MNTEHDKSMDPSTDMKSHDCDVLIVGDEVANPKVLNQLLSGEGYLVRDRPGMPTWTDGQIAGYAQT